MTHGTYQRVPERCRSPLTARSTKLLDDVKASSCSSPTYNRLRLIDPRDPLGFDGDGHGPCLVNMISFDDFSVSAVATLSADLIAGANGMLYFPSIPTLVSFLVPAPAPVPDPLWNNTCVSLPAPAKLARDHARQCVPPTLWCFLTQCLCHPKGLRWSPSY